MSESAPKSLSLYALTRSLATRLLCERRKLDGLDRVGIDKLTAITVASAIIEKAQLAFRLGSESDTF